MATVDSRTGADFDPIAPEVHRGLPARYGAGPGLLAGAVMYVMLGILSLAQGRGLAHPLKVVASTFLGSKAMHGGTGTIVIGALVHFSMSVLLGMLFAMLLGRTTRRRALGLGLVYSIVLWLGAQFVILPIVNPLMATAFGTVWPFFLGHLGYGAMLASALPTVYDVDGPRRRYVDPLRREVRP